jgi:hypothetical protein
MSGRGSCRQASFSMRPCFELAVREGGLGQGTQARAPSDVDKLDERVLKGADQGLGSLRTELRPPVLEVRNGPGYVRVGPPRASDGHCVVTDARVPRGPFSGVDRGLLFRADGGIAPGGGFRRLSVQPNWLRSSFRQVASRWQTSCRSEEASRKRRPRAREQQVVDSLVDTLGFSELEHVSILVR